MCVTGLHILNCVGIGACRCVLLCEYICVEERTCMSVCKHVCRSMHMCKYVCLHVSAYMLVWGVAVHVGVSMGSFGMCTHLLISAHL